MLTTGRVLFKVVQELLQKLGLVRRGEQALLVPREEVTVRPGRAQGSLGAWRPSDQREPHALLREQGLHLLQVKVRHSFPIQGHDLVALPQPWEDGETEEEERESKITQRKDFKMKESCKH